MNLKIKNKYMHAVVGFNNSGEPLGKREDLHLLAEMAHHDPSLAELFEKLPTLKEIEKHKTGLVMAKTEAMVKPAATQTDNTDAAADQVKE